MANPQVTPDLLGPVSFVLTKFTDSVKGLTDAFKSLDKIDKLVEKFTAPATTAANRVSGAGYGAASAGATGAAGADVAAKLAVEGFTAAVGNIVSGFKFLDEVLWHTDQVLVKFANTVESATGKLTKIFNEVQAAGEKFGEQLKAVLDPITARFKGLFEEGHQTHSVQPTEAGTRNQAADYAKTIPKYPQATPIAAGVPGFTAKKPAAPEAAETAKAGGMMEGLGGMLGKVAVPLVVAQIAMEGFHKAVKLAEFALFGVVRVSEQVAHAITPFVEALSPATILVMNQAMRDLQATIGYALVPVAEVLTSVFKQIGGILLPAMEQLRPIFATVSAAIGGALLEVLRAMVSTFQALMPAVLGVTSFVVMLADQLAIAADMTAVFVKTFEDVIAVFSGMGSGNGIWAALNDALKLFSKSTMLGTFTMLRFVDALSMGMTNLSGKFAKAVEDLAKAQQEKAAGLVAAPSNAAAKDAAAIARDAAVAAFAAQGAGGGVKDQVAWLADIAGIIKEQQKIDIAGAIKDGVKEIVQAILNPQQAAKNVIDILPGGQAVNAGLGILDEAFSGKNINRALHKGFGF